jgi:glycosyltransferase involved in cell wall biosynthesis
VAAARRVVRGLSLPRVTDATSYAEIMARLANRTRSSRDAELAADLIGEAVAAITRAAEKYDGPEEAFCAVAKRAGRSAVAVYLARLRAPVTITDHVRKHPEAFTFGTEAVEGIDQHWSENVADAVVEQIAHERSDDDATEEPEHDADPEEQRAEIRALLGAGVLTREQARASVGVDQGAFVVGCAARFDPVKGLDVLLCAVATVDGVTLVLIGDGPEAPRLDALAAPLGARVIRTGEVNGAARLFAGFDAYAAPSAKEGMPLAVLEAIALGVPVVASDIPAHREVLGADYPALLPRTPEAFATGLRRTVTDAEWRHSLAAQGLARAGRFDAARMVEAIARLYREALAGRGVGGRPVHLPVVG